MFDTAVSAGLGFVTAAGCAASALLGCGVLTAAAGMANITIEGAMNAAIQGNDPFTGATDALHDPSQWVGALFDGGAGAYFKFK